jgi:hypothetical protein
MCACVYVGAVGSLSVSVRACVCVLGGGGGLDPWVRRVLFGAQHAPPPRAHTLLTLRHEPARPTPHPTSAPPPLRPSATPVSCGRLGGLQVRDLLGEDPLKRLELKEDPTLGVFVKDLIFVEVASVEAIDRVMRDGYKNRTVGATLMNAESSRSHSIFTVRRRRRV